MHCLCLPKPENEKEEEEINCQLWFRKAGHGRVNVRTDIMKLRICHHNHLFRGDIKVFVKTVEGVAEISKIRFVRTDYVPRVWMSTDWRRPRGEEKGRNDLLSSAV